MAAARCKAPTSMGLEFPLSDDILNHYLRNEEEHVQELLLGYTLEQKTREQIRISHMNQVRTIVEKLKATPEGNGTMFDNTMVMYFPEGGEAHHAQGTESPWVIVSGKNCNLDIAGRYIRMPYYMTEGHQTLGNWYTTLLNAYGNPIPHFGAMDLGLQRMGIDQSGAIKQFLG